MTQQLTRTFTPEQDAQRLLCASLKVAVKADYPALRKHRETTGKARDAAWQFTLHQMKQQARARLLIYGFVRGHKWERMEKNHPAGAGVSPMFVSYYLKRAWEQAVASLDEAVRSFVVKPKFDE